MRRKITGFLVSLFLASWTVDCESSDCGGPLKPCCLGSPLTGPHKGKDRLRDSAVAWPGLLTRPSLKAVTWSTHLLFSRNVWGVKGERERWVYVPVKEREKERSEAGHSSDDFAWHLSGTPPRSGSQHGDGLERAWLGGLIVLECYRFGLDYLKCFLRAGLFKPRLRRKCPAGLLNVWSEDHSVSIACQLVRNTQSQAAPRLLAWIPCCTKVPMWFRGTISTRKHLLGVMLRAKLCASQVGCSVHIGDQSGFFCINTKSQLLIAKISINSSKVVL